MVIYHDTKEKNITLNTSKTTLGHLLNPPTTQRKTMHFLPDVFVNWREGECQINRSLGGPQSGGGGSAIPWLLCSKLFFQSTSPYSTEKWDPHKQPYQ